MLTEEEIEILETQGYLSLGKLLTDAQVKAINDMIETLMLNEGQAAGAELVESKYIRHPKEEGADRLADLVNKGDVFDVFYTHPRVLAGIAAVLGPSFKLSSLNYRAAKPGLGHQNLHIDWGNKSVHGVSPQERMKDPSLPHPDEVIIKAPAGSVFIFNSHAWHGGTTNRTTKPRRSIHSYFCTSDQPQQIDQRKYITEETKQRIGLAAQKILDVL